MTSVRMRTPDLPTPAVQWTRVGGRAGSITAFVADADGDLGEPEIKDKGFVPYKQHPLSRR